MKNLLLPLMALAFAGLALSVVTTLCMMAGVAPPLGEATKGLHIGIFIVWIPAMLISIRLAHGYPRRDFWKIAFRGCPAWMRYAVYGFFAYALVAFVLVNIILRQTNVDPWLGFTGHWMVFYAAAGSIFFSAWNQAGKDLRRRCPVGHLVEPTARFCPQCGQLVQMKA